MRPVMTHVALHVADVAACAAFYADYCGMRVVHERGTSDDERVVWLAEPGREQVFVFVLIPGGDPVPRPASDISHLGFALESRSAVDAVAAKARADGLLAWPPRDEPYPVGYFCGVRDPTGRVVEFSYGQPLGPGADALGG